LPQHQTAQLSNRSADDLARIIGRGLHLIGNFDEGQSLIETKLQSPALALTQPEIGNDSADGSGWLKNQGEVRFYSIMVECDEFAGIRLANIKGILPRY
jgi:hypothetical protein